MDKGLEHQMDEADCFSPATDRRSRPHEQEAASKQSPEHLPLSGIWEGAGPKHVSMLQTVGAIRQS